jgi:hypothetical protein
MALRRQDSSCFRRSGLFENIDAREALSKREVDSLPKDRVCIVSNTMQAMQQLGRAVLGGKHRNALAFHKPSSENDEAGWCRLAMGSIRNSDAVQAAQQANMGMTKRKKKVGCDG